MERRLKDYLMLSVKGMCMGAADVVPGVSGGTIAFITGIYDELINSIKSINAASLKMLFTGEWRAFWKMINGRFLLFLLMGIGISVFSLAKIITWLLDAYPILVWSFFFGLVLASTWFVGKDVKERNWKTGIGFLFGAASAFYITVATPAETSSSLFFVFLCGAIAICAMILPGISGSFILVLLGKYFFIMEAVKTFDLKVIAVFGVGACVGITSFSRLLSYALSHMRNVTLAVLSGFMLGSLNKVWPWKEIIEGGERNIAPNGFVWQAGCLAVLGFLMVYGIEKISSKSSD